MIELLTVLTLSVVLGAVVGIMPGFTPILGLLVAMPLVADYSAEMIVLFWACYLSVTQYYGSVGALLFKVPGETSSLPVLINSESLTQTRSVVKGYRLTAFSSLIASLTGVMFFLILVWWLKDSWYWLFSVKFSVLFLLLIFILLIINHKKWWFNLSLVSLGLIISYIPDSNQSIQICSDNSWACFLLNPVDFNLAIICLYAVPFLFIDQQHFAKRQFSITVVSWKPLIRYKWLALRHALLGLAVGFVPGMGTTLSSNISARLEASRNQYQRLKIMAAAESANNSAIITSMVPFLFMGLPITGTELFLDNWLQVFKATSINYEILYQPFNVFGTVYMPFYMVLALSLVAICALCFVLTSRFIGFYNLLTQVPDIWFTWGVRILVIVFTAIAAINASPSGWTMTIVTIIVFSFFGSWCHSRHLDLIALPVAMVVGKYAIDRFIIAYTLWS